MIAQQQRLAILHQRESELTLCNMGLFKNEFKIILFAAIKKIILKWISTNWLSMEITLYKKHKFPCNESLYSSL